MSGVRRLGRRARGGAHGGGPSAAGGRGRTGGADADRLDLARRTAWAADRTVGGVRPLWLARQDDLGSASFVPRGELDLLANVTHRTWTALGTPTTVGRPTVDERGLVTPWPGGWSLDWWVGAEDRWHLPSTEAAVRQRLVEGAPVVETVMRVPGGDVVHRAYVVAGPGDEGDLVVVEVENATPVPVAVAFAVRPWNPVGVAAVGSIGLQDERTVLVDGRPALHLPRPPSRAAAATAADGDVAAVVVGGGAGPRLPDELVCADGLLTAAVLFPLPHTATVRVVLPVTPGRAGPAGGGRGRGGPDGAGAAATGPALPARVPDAAQVAGGWRALAERGTRWTIPDDRLTAAVAATRRALLVGHAAHLADPATPLADVATVLGALGRLGLHDEVAAVLVALPERQRPDGRYDGPGDAALAAGAALHAVGAHWRRSGDAAPVAATAGSLGLAVRWLARWADRRPPGGRSGATAGPTPGELWALRGLGDLAPALVAAGEARAGDDVAAVARRLAATVDLSGDALPLDALWPLDLDVADGARATALAAARGAGAPGPGDDGAAAGPVVAAVAPTGLDVRATLRLAVAEVAAGDRRGLARLRWALEVASPTWTWPEVLHPRTGGGSAGDGHDRVAGAELVHLVATLVVHDGPTGLDLCPVLPEGWEGAGLEAHEVPTTRGRLSYALRWHGDRPALLWELEARPGEPPARLRAPGLDPAWSSTAPRGEALLAPFAPPGGGGPASPSGPAPGAAAPAAPAPAAPAPPPAPPPASPADDEAPPSFS